MSKPKSTFIASSTSGTTELGWKLKRITDSHAMRRLMAGEERDDELEPVVDLSKLH